MTDQVALPECPVDGCVCNGHPDGAVGDAHNCLRCGSAYHPQVCPDCIEDMTKEALASAPNIGGTEAHRALNYMWSAMQAAGIASGDLAGAYVTVREALNERQETPR